MYVKFLQFYFNLLSCSLNPNRVTFLNFTEMHYCAHCYLYMHVVIIIAVNLHTIVIYMYMCVHSCKSKL